MRLSDLLRCSKPLLFEDGFEGYEYSGGGTFFLGKYKDIFFAITAKHCLLKRDRNSLRLMFDELSDNEDKFIPLRRMHVVEDPPEGPVDYTDLVLVELDRDQMTDEQRRSSWFVDFDWLIKRDVNFAPNCKLVTRGFPNGLGGIDYDEGIISVEALGFSGKYRGPSGTGGLHFFEFQDIPDQVVTVQGMSGSPVFLVEQVKGGLDHWFAGMIVRGNLQSGLCGFIDCSVIFSALQRLLGVPI